jgi:hypothetical protein
MEALTRHPRFYLCFLLKPEGAAEKCLPKPFVQTLFKRNHLRG